MINEPLSQDSLAFSLLAAAQAVTLVRGGNALPQALSQIFSKSRAPAQARGAIQDISFRTMRRLGRAETLLAAMTQKQPEPPLLYGLACCALALISDPQEQRGDAPYNDFTVVDQAVSAAASDPSIAHAKGMINAVLRRFLREREVQLNSALSNPLARWNYPVWWINAIKAVYPNDWSEILAAGNALPPLTLRVNCRKTTPDAFMQKLAEHAIASTQVGPSAVRLAQPIAVSQIPGFEQGLASVQDAAAQLAAPLLDLRDGMRVLDACAAPGGKTGHILECADVDLLALDNEPGRLPRIAENLRRLQLDAKPRAGDASRTDWWDGQPFDRILADVPCTASGIVRRHPDIRWLRRKSDAAQLASLSQQILDNLWQMLRPEGKMLFVTCSIWPQESEAQAAAFAARNRAMRLPAPGQLLPTANREYDRDGLFFALFQKATI